MIPSCQSGSFLASTFTEPTRGSRATDYGTHHGQDGVTCLVNLLASTRTDPSDAPMNRERRTHDQLAVSSAIGRFHRIRLAHVSFGYLVKTNTGRERLIRSHSSARFCFELSGNSN